MTTMSRRSGAGPARSWNALTYELADGKSPVRLFVADLLGKSTEVSLRHRDAAGELLVPAGGANPGTLGAAFDFALRLLLDPVPNLALAATGAHPAHCGPAVAEAFGQLVRDLGARVDREGNEPVRQPRVLADRDPQVLCRAAWALALLTEVFRTGALHPASPLAALAGQRGPVNLLEMASEAAVAELAALIAVAHERLLPALETRPAPWWIGPTFTGSQFMAADADLIAGGLLLEVKTHLGEKRPDGSRRTRIEPATFRQLLGYALLDFDDEYEISELGVYDARYGQLSIWPVNVLLAETSGRTVDFDAARRDFRQLLTAGT